MSAQTRLKDLADYIFDRNKALERLKTSGEIAMVTPNWDKYSESARSQIIAEAHQKQLSSFRAKLVTLAKIVADEVRSLRVDLEKIKYPLRFSKDNVQRSIGAQSKTNALLFLQSKPCDDRLVAEILNAIEAGDIDYAYAIRENRFNDFKKDTKGQPLLNPGELELKRQIDAAFMAYETANNVPEKESEYERCVNVNRAVEEIGRQEDNKLLYIYSPEVFPVLNETQRETMKGFLRQSGNLTEQVAFKKRADALLSAGF